VQAGWMSVRTEGCNTTEWYLVGFYSSNISVFGVECLTQQNSCNRSDKINTSNIETTDGINHGTACGYCRNQSCNVHIA